MKRVRRKIKIFVGIEAVLLLILFIAIWKNITTSSAQQIYSAKAFGFENLKSAIDYDNDEIDDYTDIMLGAREYVKSRPQYKSGYYKGGYPPEGVGVCSDVVWKAFSAAGYYLKDLVDRDISESPESYTSISSPDPNIDFRRVKNLKVFFDRKATVLTLDKNDISQWQQGDIIVSDHHIAILSDVRNKEGLPYIIHHNDAGAMEADDINNYQIIGHYRWDGIK